MDDQRCSLTITENKENTNLVPKSNHNNNAASSIKPMMPLNNSNAANSKTNGKISMHQNVIHSTSLFSGIRSEINFLFCLWVAFVLLQERTGVSIHHGLNVIITI